MLKSDGTFRPMDENRPYLGSIFFSYAKRGIVTLCIGGVQGIALALELI